MLVIVDASTIVSAALKHDSIPRQALLLARDRHTILLSEPVFAEIDGVLARPKFVRAITAEVRAEILGLLTAAASWVVSVGRSAHLISAGWWPEAFHSAGGWSGGH